MTAELYVPSTGASCRLPRLPIGLHQHTQDSGLLCGGSGGSQTRETCMQWSSGSWNRMEEKLEVFRSEHVSWTPDPSIGTYLMGGRDSTQTTTLIKPDGSQEPGFALKYLTKFA